MNWDGYFFFTYCSKSLLPYVKEWNMQNPALLNLLAQMALAGLVLMFVGVYLGYVLTGYVSRKGARQLRTTQRRFVIERRVTLHDLEREHHSAEE